MGLYVIQKQVTAADTSLSEKLCGKVRGLAIVAIGGAGQYDWSFNQQRQGVLKDVFDGQSHNWEAETFPELAGDLYLSLELGTATTVTAYVTMAEGDGPCS